MNLALQGHPLCLVYTTSALNPLCHVGTVIPDSNLFMNPDQARTLVLYSQRHSHFVVVNDVTVKCEENGNHSANLVERGALAVSHCMAQGQLG